MSRVTQADWNALVRAGEEVVETVRFGSRCRPQETPDHYVMADALNTLPSVGYPWIPDRQQRSSRAVSKRSGSPRAHQQVAQPAGTSSSDQAPGA